MSPRLTVIIPVYNGMPFLPEAVNSILSQTYSDFRLLLINDGSTDSSSEYLASLDDPRVEVIQQNNLGLCHSLNQAVFDRTESEFVARLDQDDVAFPSRLEEQINFLIQHPGYACVLSNISRIGGDGREFGYYKTEAKDLIEDYELQRYGCIVHSTIVFRREKFIEVGGYRQALYPVDDFDLLLRFWENSPVAVIKKPLVKYRIHGKASTFSSFWTMETNTRYVLEMHQRRVEGKGEIPFDEWVELDKPSGVERLMRYIRGVGKLYFREAGKLIGEGKNLQGVFYLVIALSCHPSFVTKRLLALRQRNQPES